MLGVMGWACDFLGCSIFRATARVAPTFHVGVVDGKYALNASYKKLINIFQYLVLPQWLCAEDTIQIERRSLAEEIGG
jgi:hypothetical protein